MAKQKTTPNAKGQVKLREKALADGSKSLYLDINMNGKRHKEYLKLYLTVATTAAEREKNKKTLAAANAQSHFVSQPNARDRLALVSPHSG